jgi:hypothetical protein
MSMDAFEFEKFIIEKFDGEGNTIQQGDKGIDGKMKDGTAIQVKKSEKIGRNVVDNFLSAVKRSDKLLFEKNIKAGNPVGYIIAFSFSKGIVEEVARLKNKDKVIIELKPVEEIIAVAKKPKITLNFKDLSKEPGDCTLEFTATAKSDNNIEFFAWDFDFDPEKQFNAIVFRDKKGVQIKTFNAGRHTIAVKAFDNNGMENIETIVLQVNGMVMKV